MEIQKDSPTETFLLHFSTVLGFTLGLWMAFQSWNMAFAGSAQYYLWLGLAAPFAAALLGFTVARAFIAIVAGSNRS